MTAALLPPQVFQNDTGLIRVWELPWPALREFEIRNVARGAFRGRHAHRTCDQVIRCSFGSFLLTTQHSNDSVRGWPMGAGDAVHVPRMHWIELTEFSFDAVVTVLCSELYSPPIVDFEEFLREGKA